VGPATFQHKVLRRFVGGFAWQTIALAVGTWAVFLFAMFALYQGWLSGWAMVAIAVICNFYSFTVLHEAVHENIEGKSRGGWLTEVMGWSSGAMFMAPFRAFRRIHLTHHQNTNKPNLDPDYWVASKNFLSTLLRCLTIYPHYIYSYLFKIDREGEPITRDIGVLVIYWGAAIVTLYTPYWALSLFGFILPTFIGTGVQALLFDWFPHHPHQETSQKLNTRNVPGRTLHILMAGQNVHQLHHVNPRVPFYRYHEAFKAAALPADQAEKEAAST
jgi:beta-carotene hydroxylase